MKKILILLGTLMIAGLSLAVDYIPIYPMTNVMEVTVGVLTWTDLANLRQGISRLQGQYDDDELIILEYYPVHSGGNAETEAMFGLLGASEGVSVFFNGEKRTQQANPLLRYGQPVWGEMSAGRLGGSPLYIDELTFDGNSIDFMLKDAADEVAFDVLNVYYLVVETMDGAFPIVKYIASESVSTADGVDQALSHTVSGNFTGDQYKAVVLIRDENMKVLQSASSQRVLKPFRIVKTGRMSRITDNLNGDRNYKAELKYVYVVSTTRAEGETMMINADLHPEILPDGMSVQFCSDGGLCIPYDDISGFCDGEVELTDDTPCIEIYAEVCLFGVTGYTRLRFVFDYEDYSVEFPLFHTSDDVDVLIIQDDAGEETEGIILEALSRLELTSRERLTYGVFMPAWGDLIREDISAVRNIIWNAPTLYPALNSQSLEYLGGKVTDGANLIVFGQWLAKVMTDNELSDYSDTQMRDFLANVLSTELVSGNVANYNIIGSTLIDIDFDIELMHDGANGHYSTNSISAKTGGEVFLHDNAGNGRAVTGFAGQAHTSLLDFDLNSVGNQYHRTRLLSAILNYYGVQNVSEKEETMPTVVVSTLSLYPNPVRGSLNINYSSESRSVKGIKTPPEYAIFNIKGQKVTGGRLTPSSKGFDAKIDVDKLSLSSGLYFVRVKDAVEQRVQKVLVVK